jgi:hypothetical protein
VRFINVGTLTYITVSLLPPPQSDVSSEEVMWIRKEVTHDLEGVCQELRWVQEIDGGRGHRVLCFPVRDVSQREDELE